MYLYIYLKKNHLDLSLRVFNGMNEFFYGILKSIDLIIN